MDLRMQILVLMTFFLSFCLAFLYYYFLHFFHFPFFFFPYLFFFFYILYFCAFLITARKRNCGKVMSSEVFVCPRGSPSLSREVSIQGNLCPGGISVQGVSLSRGVSVRASGWYTSYWNAFLFSSFFSFFIFFCLLRFFQVPSRDHKCLDRTLCGVVA